MKIPKEFFIFDLANNHCGDVEFGKRIIDEFISVIKSEGIDGAIKFQFRDLDTFINTDPIHSGNKYIKRFSETRMQDAGFEELLKKLRSNNVKTVCTPFDENSVKKIVEMGIDIIKIGSCSAMDWRLLEAAAKSEKPIICSVGGLSFDEIGKVVSFLESNRSEFALMHCVSIYPTKDEDLELNQIAVLKKRFPNATIGYSTHENPDNYDAIKIACGLGAEIFEKHITIDSDIYSANDYSIKPQHAVKWIKSYKKARTMIGGDKIKQENIEKQISGLNLLKRGVVASQDIKEGEILDQNNTVLQFPLAQDQLSSFKWNDGITAKRNYKSGEAICNNEIDGTEGVGALQRIVSKLKVLLKNSGVSIPFSAKITISHHDGIENFNTTGCVQIDIYNDSFFQKKLIVLFPGQTNPIHFHEEKKETFFVLKGTAKIFNESEVLFINEGESLEIKENYRHGFSAEDAVIIEEIASLTKMHDSTYIDDYIQNLDVNKRKTIIDRKKYGI